MVLIVFFVKFGMVLMLRTGGVMEILAWLNVAFMRCMKNEVEYNKLVDYQ